MRPSSLNGQSLTLNGSRYHENSLSLETANSRQAGKLQSHLKRADLCLLLGGTGKQVGREIQPRIPNFLNRCISLDMDACGNGAPVREELTISGDGEVGNCIQHANNYPPLANWPMISGMPLTDFGDGAAMCRCHTTAAFATHFHDVEQRLTSVIQEILNDFEGREAKRLAVAIVASNSGGSGSALGFLVAMLVRHITRPLDPSLVVVIEWHLVNVKAFETVLSTPAEKLKANDNALTVLKELQFSQNPANLEGLAQAFGLSKPVGPLFDKVQVYDSVTQGSGALSEQDLCELIGGNIAAGQNETLVGQLQSHGRNTTRSLEGVTRRGGPDSCILAAQRSTMLKASVGNLNHLTALQALTTNIDQVLGLRQDSGETQIGHDIDRSLALNERFDSISQKLRNSATETARLPEDPRLTDETIQLRERRAEQNWREGHESLKDSARNLARSLPEDARSAFEEIRAELEESSTARGHERCLLAAHDNVSSRLVDTEDEIQRITGARWDERVEAARNAFVRRSGGLFRSKRSRECSDYVATFNNRVAQQSRQVILEIFRDQFLVPLRNLLHRDVKRIRARVEEVYAVRTEAQRQGEDLVESFDQQPSGVTEVIRRSDVEPAAKRIQEELRTLHAHEAPLLTWQRLARVESVQQELEHVLRAQFDRVDDFIRTEWCDVRGVLRFVGRTDLSLEQWIVDAAQLPLPCRLDMSEYGRAHSPRLGFVAAATDLEAMVRRIEMPRDITFEFVPNDDPFQIIVQINQTHAPISAFPGLREIVRKAGLFRASSDPKTPWGYASLHHTFEAAQQVELLPPVNGQLWRNRLAGMTPLSGSARFAADDDSPIMRNVEL